MLSVQKQLAIRAKRLRIDCLKRKRETSDKTLLSQVFSQWRTYKRFINEIYQFVRSFKYVIKMKILKKKRQLINSICSSHEQVELIRRDQDISESISRSYDLKNDFLTHIRLVLLRLIRIRPTVVDEQAFIQKMREMLSRDDFDIIKPAYGQTFIQFFEFARKTHEESRNGCATTIRMNQLYGIDLLWILYYLSSERLPKSWFPNPESDFAFVFEELKSVLGRMNQSEEDEPLEQPDYCPEHCSLCGSETIQGTCFNTECMRRRESACASCGHPIIEGSNAVEVDGMRLHQDCANHNQHNSHFRDYTECSVCGCSSNDMSFVEGIGLVCSDCISLNQ